jgi:uncharacterized integral membrane protein
VVLPHYHGITTNETHRVWILLLLLLLLLLLQLQNGNTLVMS